MIWYGHVLPRVCWTHGYICISSVSVGAVRALRKGGRDDGGGLYMVGDEVCCRSESMNCNEFVGLWGEFRLSRDILCVLR